ncbi:potassium-transporting ATPase subunit KdpA [Clostridium sp. CX1]|uniref:potassium-transporting ATPase subunit KdpA n=1 Tax=Clostridium sp. CX1 TaxID=2978346 RepID=UPI0021BF8C5C|nr:potassium-transporting ATPase subunit KdpA [Clostridium sp. CX1]MCT8975235.1 potassium-transporting ATPase subunit KdpA [Clostridium sp. CX1]
MDILQIVISLGLFILIAIPLGKYLYKVSVKKKTLLDSVLNPVDKLIYKITGIKEEEMNWKTYLLSLLVTNAVMTLIVYLIFRLQGMGIFNPNGIKPMEQSLSFNTAISFITNTNLQHYSGESGLSYLSQMAAITYLMFTSAGTGYSAAVAFIRGLSGKKSFGNFFVDLVRIHTRVLLPLSVIVTLLLVWQGTPQTLSSNLTINTIEGKLQDIPLGPVASLEAIKHIGTNGGGFFGANATHPFENPTPLSNLINMLSMMILPGALVLALGHMLKNKKQAYAIFAAMSVLFITSLTLCYISEKAGNPILGKLGLSQLMGSMEGKEVRFGIAGSSLFTTVTTAFTTGAVNNMHDTLTPLGGLVPLWQMMLNVVFGGKGVGLMNMLMYIILTVFLCGLMVGRTPEFLQKKIEGKEMKLIAIAILVHPVIILIPSAIALITQGDMAGITNPSFHGLSQVLYEFASSAANNGSGFEGLADNTIFWNTATGLVMFFGRYMSIILLLAVAASLAEKNPVPVTDSTFRTDNSMFVVMLSSIIIIVAALTFFPALSLGPIAEHLTLWR